MTEYIRWIAENFNFKSQAYANYVLKMHYETTFGIFDHIKARSKGRRPLSGISATPGNTVGKHRLIENTLDRYTKFKIHEITKMTYLEYITLPMTFSRELDVKCELLYSRKAQEDNDQQASMNKQIQMTLGNVGKMPPDTH